MDDRDTLSKIASGSSYLVMENLVNTGLGMVFWLVLAKMVSPGLLGQVIVVTSLATAILGFLGFGVRITVSKYVAEFNVKKMYDQSRRVIRIGLKIALIASVAVAAGISILADPIANGFYHDASLGVLIILLMPTFLPSQAASFCFKGAFQGGSKWKYNVIVDTIFVVSRQIIALGLILYGLGNMGIILSFTISSALSTIIAYFVYLPKILPRKTAATTPTDTETPTIPLSIGSIVKFSGWNYFAQGMIVLNLQIGILLLGSYDFEGAAFFGLSLFIARVVGTAINSVGRASVPVISEYSAMNNRDKFNHTFDFAMRFSLVLTGFLIIVFLLAPEEILNLLSKEYSVASTALRILVIATFINALTSLPVSILNGLGRAKEVGKIMALTGIITITSSAVLIPFFGIEGAGLAVFIGSAFNIAHALLRLRKTEGIAIPTNAIIKSSVPIVIAIVMGFALLLLLHNTEVAIAGSMGFYVLLLFGIRPIKFGEVKQLLSVVGQTLRFK